MMDFYNLLKGADMPASFHSRLGALLIKRGGPSDNEVAFKSFIEGIAAGDTGSYALAANCCIKGIGTPVDFGRGLSILEAGTKAGDVSSACALAIMYLEGNGVDRDVPRAVSYFSTAADHGSGYAAWMLGTIYGYEGYGVKDIQKSIVWHHAAANLCYYDSYLNLGLMYYSGADIPRDAEKAFGYFETGANHGILQCTYMMGFLMSCGDVPGGEEKGLSLIMQAADAGDESALVYMGGYRMRNGDPAGAVRDWIASGTEDARIMYNLGYAFENGDGVERDYETAYGYYRASADGGDMDAVYRLGTAFLEGDLGLAVNEDRGLSYIMRAADAGNAAAEFSMGVFYAYGKMGFDRDPEFAMQWYEKSAKQNYPEALYHVGLAYYINGMYAQDFLYGLNCLSKAYEGGYSAAAVALGVCFTEGKATQRDYPKAAALFREAAEQGSADGCYNLARFYETGTGVEKDLDAAYGWYKKAFEAGSDPTVAEALKRLRPFVTSP